MSPLEEKLNNSFVSHQSLKIDVGVEYQQRRRTWPRALQAYWKNVRSRPVFTLLPPVLIFCVLCALGVMGVALGADKFESDTRSRAESAALDWAASFRLSHEKVFTPLVTLAILIQQNPQLASVLKSFPKVADQLFDSVGQHGVIQELQVSPMGVISMIYPNNSDTRARLGINLFKQPTLRSGALNTIQKREIIMNGPVKLVQGNFGTISRIPIFIEGVDANEAFGGNVSLPDGCPREVCYNATAQEKFWGFATSIGPLDDLRAGNDSRLDMLKQKGYKWLMTRPYTESERTDPALNKPAWTDRFGDYVFSASPRWPSSKAVASNISIANAVWQVYLEPEDGFRPDWEKGVYAAVVLGSLLTAVLVGIIMASWAEQQRLLGNVMESNKQLEQTTGKLQEEKLRLDALLVRQYNLIAVLGKPHRSQSCRSPDGNGSPDSSAGMALCEGLTLDRIENMRRQLAVNSNSSTQDMESIQTIELLGEGMFGKVYRGLWRGSVVAVKTMLLPANMSGAEKREKMAVMEAAISSSLSHPNIVQTYTYTIRPMRDKQSPLPPPPQLQHSQPPQLLQQSFTGEALPLEPPCETVDSSSSSNVHSYEVRLVLEYCDKGCLRAALDDGIFILENGGINYLAILDTAADVAKAMLHLHSLNVLHSDLKARNVMLSTGNTDGRGLVGKVGDFGLSLKMDSHETHVSQVFQGTYSHMAPEILLEGRLSKQADVYAFGITLWEMYTGRRPFEGIPRALLGHQITKENLRPRFPFGTPHAYQALAEACWQQEWEKRPSFGDILKELVSMRAADSAPTPPLSVALRTRGTTTSSSSTPSNGPDSRGRLAAVTGMAGGAHSAGGEAPLIIIGSTAHTDHELSFYLDHSADSADWSRGASGRSLSAPPLVPRSRPARMPQIRESDEMLLEQQLQLQEQQLLDHEQQLQQHEQRLQRQQQQQVACNGPTSVDVQASHQQQQQQGIETLIPQQRLQELQQHLQQSQPQAAAQQQQQQHLQQQPQQPDVLKGNGPHSGSNGSPAAAAADAWLHQQPGPHAVKHAQPD